MADSTECFRNQYLLVKGATQPVAHGAASVSRFGEWTLYAHAPLQVTHRADAANELLILGPVVDPSHPEHAPRDIALAMWAATGGRVSRMQAWSQRLTGRFIIAFTNGTTTSFWGDACHLRPLLFGRFDGERQAVGSSEVMMLKHMGATLQMSEAKRAFVASRLYQRNECAWVGAQGCDDRIQRVLPNHWLDMPSGQVRRRHLEADHLPNDEKTIVQRCIATLQGSLQGFSSRYKLVQAVTAGWDSRMLLAASLPIKNSIEYYIFERGDAGSMADAQVAKSLANSLALDFEVVRPAPVDEAFAQAFREQHLFARVLPKTANIQHHRGREDGDRTININGNGGEIWRCYYGEPSATCSFNMACHLLGYRPDDPHVRAALSPWFDEATLASAQMGVSMLDLLYWEQRMGNWGAQTPFELDIALEEISPFNNVDLALSMLRIDSRQRSGPDYPVCMEMTAIMSARAAAIPVNPHVPRWRKHLARYQMATYAIKRAKHLMA